VSALAPMILTDKQDSYQLGLSMEYLEDKDKKWTIEDVSSDEMGRQFKKMSSNNLNFGYTKSAYWLKFKLKNDSKLTRNWFIEIDYPAIESIDLFISGENGFVRKRNGVIVPYSEREFKNRTLIFPIKINSNSEIIYYIKCLTFSSMNFSAKILTESALRVENINETLFYGIFFGFNIVMIIYNLFIYLSVRDKSYIYYILYQFFWGSHMLTLTGFGMMYIWGNLDQLLLATYINSFGLFSFIILFAKSFLKLNVYSKLHDKLLTLLIILAFIISSSTYIYTLNMRFESIFLLFIPIIIFSAAIVTYKKGYKAVRFFLLGWSIHLAAIITFILRLIGIFPSNFITNNIQYIGSAIEMTLLSLALADRINIMKSENAELKLKAESEISKFHKLESLAMLAGGMAHDLNNILTGLFMKVQVLTSLINKDSDKAAGYMYDFNNIFNLAKNIINRLQTFSKGDALYIKQESISKLLSEAGNIVLTGSNSQCEVVILEGLWPVEFDKTQLNQVITNLLINADQAMPYGGKIEVTAENIILAENMIPSLAKGKYIKITIRDNGIGISKENIDKIFDPFFTTKPTGQGLGLAMSYSIIKKHKGHIEVKSELSKGTSFYIYLPVSESTKVVDEKTSILDDRQLVGKNILIMDDNETLLEGISTILSDKGCIVDQARNGDEAITLYKKALTTEEPYDILIIDVTISGGMGGITAIKLLREIDPMVRAIVSSGYSQIPVMHNFRQYGFVSALPKPYTIEELCFVLGKSLES
ncbi:MAG: response regulator, partial [Nitrospirae bacterium]|nr:response regulator [Nitrospirota bacterium]